MLLVVQKNTKTNTSCYVHYTYLSQNLSDATFASTLSAVSPASEEPHGNEMVQFASEDASAETTSLITNSNVSSSGHDLSASEFDAPLVHGAINRGSARASSQNSNAIVPANTNLNGNSIFQGYL